MIRLLIVDDEPEVLSILQAQMDWARLGVQQVLTAGNYQQALDVCQQNDVQIMICDIEMPRHSGLELMETVNERFGNIVAIFLTGYDSFAYCKRALELGGLEYLLKPAQPGELEAAVMRAVEKVQKQRRILQFTSFEEDLSSSPATDGAMFWLNVINGIIPPQKDVFLAAASRYRVALDEGERYAILLLRAPAQSGATRPAARIIQLQSVARSLADGLDAQILSALTLLDQYIAFILYSPHPSERMLLEVGDRLIVADASGEAMEAVTSGYVPPWCVPEQMEQLLWLYRNTVCVSRATFSLRVHDIRQSLEAFPLAKWSGELSFGRFQTLEQELHAYLERQSRGGSGRISKEALGYFLYEFVRMVQALLEEKGVSTEWLTEGNSLYQPAFRSLEGCEAYALDALNRLRTGMSEAVSRNDIVESAKKYIKTNLYEDLNREQIANQIGVNAEYLSRLFKKRTGLSLVEYISQKKIDVAANLLSTPMTVGEVAIRLGYTNFAYFTQVFKKYTGFTPTAFKKQFKE